MNRRRMLAIARAEWLHNRRDPRSLFVIAALPVVLLLLYGYGINYDLDHIPFGIYDLSGTQASRDLLEQFRANRYFALSEVVTSRGQIGELLDHGRAVFVLVIPPTFAHDLGAARNATVQVVLDGSDTTRANVAVGYVEAAILDYSARLATRYVAAQGSAAIAPFSVRPTILYNPGLKSVNFIVPGLIALLLTLLAALLTSTSVVREREWGSFESLVASPARSREILVGKMLPYVVVAFADVVMCVIAGALIFGVRPVGSLAALLGASAIFLLASLSIGILFSVLARTQQMAILLAMLVTLLPTTLLSGFAFPLRSMPLALRAISNIIPATHFLVIIRSIYLKGAPVSVLLPRVGVLVLFTALIVNLAATRFKKKL
jgi:ABC-2 type transport system permease protein